MPGRHACHSRDTMPTPGSGPSGPTHATSSAASGPAESGRRHGCSGEPAPSSKPSAPSRVPVSSVASIETARCSNSWSPASAPAAQASSAAFGSAIRPARLSRTGSTRALARSAQPTRPIASSSQGGVAACARAASASSSSAHCGAVSTTLPSAAMRGSGRFCKPLPTSIFRFGACSRTATPPACRQRAFTPTESARSEKPLAAMRASVCAWVCTATVKSTAGMKRAGPPARSMSSTVAVNAVAMRVPACTKSSTWNAAAGPTCKRPAAATARHSSGPARATRHGSMSVPVPVIGTAARAASASRLRS